MTWRRLESSSTGDDFEPALRAPIADPLWFLTRQWQVGELRGEDTGRPVAFEISTARVAVTSIQAGPPDDPRGEPQRLVPGVPVEPLVEAEPLEDTPGRTGLSARLGLQLNRMLAEAGLGPAAIRRVRDAYPIAPAAGDTPAQATLAARAPDGLAIYDDVLSGATTGLSRRAVRVVRRWAREFVAPVVRDVGSVAGHAWQATRQAYSFHLRTGTDDGRTDTALVAAEYAGGRADWFAYDVTDPPDADAPGSGPAVRRSTDRVLASAIRYGGMPADRWWQIEDEEVHLGQLDAGPTDLPRSLVGGFAATFGTDWFMVPIGGDVGDLVSITELRVLDSFGEVATIEPTAVLDHDRDGDDRPWRFMELTGDDGPAAGRAPLLFLAPTMATGSAGRPLEAVYLTRDEQSNLGWAIETVVEGRWGNRIDRKAAARAADGRSATPSGGESDDDTWTFTVDASVPEHWLPLIPVRIDGTLEPRLQRGRAPARPDVDDAAAYGAAQGRLLEPDRRLLLHDDEVIRAGVEITRRARMTRAQNGAVLSWVGRRKRLGNVPRDGKYLTDQLDDGGIATR